MTSMTSMLRWHPCWDDIHAEMTFMLRWHPCWDDIHAEMTSMLRYIHAEMTSMLRWHPCWDDIHAEMKSMSKPIQNSKMSLTGESTMNDHWHTDKAELFSSQFPSVSDSIISKSWVTSCVVWSITMVCLYSIITLPATLGCSLEGGGVVWCRWPQTNYEIGRELRESRLSSHQ